MGIVTTYLFAAAVFAFVLGIVLQQYGRRLRHAALVLFTLALLPSVVLGLLRDAGAAIAVDPFALIVGLVVLSCIAYAALQIRKQKPDGPRRVQMKRPFVHRRDTDFIEFLRRELGGDE